ncbi:MAG: hypothetical protein AVDCRST_MAG54-2026, partial [uncultured Actinomycetospora sp.]
MIGVGVAAAAAGSLGGVAVRAVLARMRRGVLVAA